MRGKRMIDFFYGLSFMFALVLIIGLDFAFVTGLVMFFCWWLFQSTHEDVNYSEDR